MGSCGFFDEQFQNLIFRFKFHSPSGNVIFARRRSSWIDYLPMAGAVYVCQAKPKIENSETKTKIGYGKNIFDNGRIGMACIRIS